MNLFRQFGAVVDLAKTFGRLALGLLFLSPLSSAWADDAPAQTPDASAQPVEIPVNDPHLLYFGRWDLSNPAQPHSHWTGAYIRTRFTGTSVGISLPNDAPLAVSIDNEAIRPLEAKRGDTPLNLKPLKPGTHSLLVGPGEGNELSFKGLLLDSGASTQAVAARPIIEFVGDSITWGTGPDGMWSVNWAWQSAESLDCDHAQIAQSARALTTGYGCADEHTGMDKQYFMLKNFGYVHDNPQVPWNFSYTPVMVVINLGQNDACGNEPDNVFTPNYVNFVKNIRAKFPNASIVALRMFGGDHFGRDTLQAVETLEGEGDKNVHFVDTQGWLDKEDFADGVHPNGHGNLKITARLVEALRPFLNGS
jgi:lysophospholipase L1-like esterase